MSVREKITNTEARSIIAAIFIIGTFIELPLFAIFAPEFFNNIYMFLLTQLGWILGYYFGAKNGEKKLEMLLEAGIPGALTTAAKEVVQRRTG